MRAPRAIRQAGTVLSVMTIALAALSIGVPAAGAGSTKGYGASFALWVRAHPVNRAHCPIGACYGPLVDSRSIEPQFSFVQTKRGLVVGYNEALRRGTSLVAAELQVVEGLPADVSLPHGVTVIRKDRYGHSCAVLNLYSPSLAKHFGSKGPAGLGNSIGVELATIGARGTPHYNPHTADFAIVIPEYLDSSYNC